MDDQKLCFYCDDKNPVDAHYCCHCGMPFPEGEIPLIPGDVFMPANPPRASLGFNTTLPFDELD